MTSSNDTANALIDRLIADFGEHPGLGCVVTRSGHGYRRRANDAQREGLTTEAQVDNFKAIALYGRVINEFGSTAVTFVARRFAIAIGGDRHDQNQQTQNACCYQSFSQLMSNPFFRTEVKQGSPDSELASEFNRRVLMLFQINKEAVQ